MFEHHEIELLTKLIKEIIMTVEDQIIALQADVTEIKTAVAALAAPVTVDLTPVLTAIAAIQAQLLPTPPAA